MTRYYPIQIFLSKGALVLEPNYRGSAGYGAAFRALNVRNLGVGDMWDVMSGVDSLIKKGIVDPAKLGSMGWSEGGYISAFLTTHTDRFKAISVGAGISDWMTYYVNTDITPFTRQYLHATPWDDPAIYAKTSPDHHHQASQNADPDPARQRRQARAGSRRFRAISWPAGPARPVALYPLPRLRPPHHQAEVQSRSLQSNLDWFSHYIWGRSVPQGFADSWAPASSLLTSK